MSKVIDSLKTQSSSQVKSWYLRLSDNSTYGPVSVNVLAEWATQGRIMPGNKISTDRGEWIPVEALRDLKMEWMADLSGGDTYGPFNILAVPHLFHSGTFSPDTKLTNRVTGKTMQVFELVKASLNVEPEAREKVQAEDLKPPEKHRIDAGPAHVQGMLFEIIEPEPVPEEPAPRKDAESRAAEGQIKYLTLQLEHGRREWSREKDELAKKLAAREEEFSSQIERLKNRVETIERDDEKVRGELSSERQEVHHLQEQLRVREEALKERTVQMSTQLDSRSAEVEKVREAADKERGELMLRIGELEESLKESRSAAQSIEREMAAQKEHHEFLIKQETAHEDTLRRKIDQLEGEVQAVGRALNQAREKYESELRLFEGVKLSEAERETELRRQANSLRVESIRLTGELEESRNKYANLQNENAAAAVELKEQSDAFRRKYEASESALAAARAEIDSLKENSANLKQKAGSDRDRLERELQAAQLNSADAGRRLNEAAEEILLLKAAAEKNNRDLLGQFKHMELRAGKASDLARDVERLLAEAERMKMDLDRSKAEYAELEADRNQLAARMEKEVDELRGRIAEDGAKLAAASKEAGEFKATAAAAAQRLDDEKERHAKDLQLVRAGAGEVAGSLEAARKEIESLRTEFDNRAIILADNANRIASLEDENVLLQQNLHNLQEQLSQATAAQEELASARTRIDETEQAYNEALSGASQQLAEATAQTADLQRENTALSDSLRTLGEQLSLARQERQNATIELERVRLRYDSLVVQHQEQEQKTSQRFDELEREKDEAIAAAVASERHAGRAISKQDRFDQLPSILRMAAALLVIAGCSALAFIIGEKKAAGVVTKTMEMNDREFDVYPPPPAPGISKQPASARPAATQAATEPGKPKSIVAPAAGATPAAKPIAVRSTIAWPDMEMDRVIVTSLGRTMTVVFDLGIFRSLTRYSEGAEALLGKVAGQIRDSIDEFDLTIEGHADHVPVSSQAGASFADNDTLGQRRADAVLALFRDKFGIPADRMKAVSLGEREPPFSNDGESTRKKNRTVVLKLTPRERQ